MVCSVSALWCFCQCFVNVLVGADCAVCVSFGVSVSVSVSLPDTSVTFHWFSDRAVPENRYLFPKSGHLGHISLVFRPSCIGDSVTEKGEISEARVIREDFLESVGDLMSRHDILLLA